MTIKENVKRILSNVDAAKAASSYSNQSVSVVAVTKSVDANLAREVFKNGVSHLAENRTELFLEKYEALKDLEITWHLIGNLQRRKVKQVINYVDYFHALDSLKLAQEINKRAEHTIKCFIELNISGEESKHGFSVNELMEILPKFSELENIEIVGLMTMAPFDATESECNDIFGRMKKLQVEISEMNLSRIPCTELSMGMSRDYEIAIKNGATFVRIGTEFFKNL
ncbi:YggS family pyridoxal phosphate-dependent enzyme [Lactococcus lactis]|uniref:YggS family pyridoxal phosphate-dependent enzyme n=1 Tax=Lactococcus lactis TaxID=1358 RepID=UPI00207D6E12|nr:YggS family pyridoxal phosphate-dependent enzyme [Lactococcus lactis]MCO0816865.1 YggS family pyridoxal phosphate-dependent enzyme [Lactococcus lactis]